MTDETKRWCFAWFKDKAPSDGNARAALVKDSKWEKGEEIRISFLDGTDDQKALVKRFASEWVDPGMANLNFSWVPTNGDIRISFEHEGSWSVIGTTCRQVPKGEPTMNFGWLTPGISDDDARGVILHEFGHALGLIHEHQNPDEAIKWNKPVVIVDLSGPPNNWDEATIEHNMFETYPPNEIAGTKLDKNSIMMYPIPASWTIGGPEVGFNSKLSDQDKKFIKKQY